VSRNDPTRRRPGPGLFALLGQLLPSFLLCALFAAVGIFHVAARVMVVRTGYELSRLEQESRDLLREHDRLKLELATLKSPLRLERLAREQLRMAPPPAASVITLGKDRGRRAQVEPQGDGAPTRLAKRGQ
jgi:cell division protein FtsL